MKWRTFALWRDPVGWSEQFVKTELRVFFWMLIHIFSVTWGIYRIQRFNPLATGASIIIFFGIIFPCMYLYALYRLIRVIRKKDENNTLP